jgi:hypothetical protein
METTFEINIRRMWNEKVTKCGEQGFDVVIQEPDGSDMGWRAHFVTKDIFGHVELFGELTDCDDNEIAFYQTVLGDELICQDALQWLSDKLEEFIGDGCLISF